MKKLCGKEFIEKPLPYGLKDTENNESIQNSQGDEKNIELSDSSKIKKRKKRKNPENTIL